MKPPKQKELTKAAIVRNLRGNGQEPPYPTLPDGYSLKVLRLFEECRQLGFWWGISTHHSPTFPTIVGFDEKITEEARGAFARGHADGAAKRTGKPMAQEVISIGPREETV